MELCKFYRRTKKCVNPNKYDCMQTVQGYCSSHQYYSMELEKEIKRLKWYLNEIRDEELKSLDIEWDEYETGCTNTEYTNIISLVEEALDEKPEEDCRYKREHE